MRLLKSILLSAIAIALPASGFAASYYVSPTGSDAAAGTSMSTPWKTIAKVNSAPLGSGDQVFFLRGGIWREMLVPSTSGLYFGAYGTGARPIISGANVVTGVWKTVSTNVCSSVVGGSDLTEVWVNGVLGAEAASVKKITAPGEWFYNGKTLTVMLATGCPTAGSTTPVVEITARPYALSISNLGAITVEHLGFVNGMYNSIYLGSNLTGIQTFNDLVWSGARYEGFLINSGTPMITDSEGLYSYSGLAAAGGNGFTLSNSILSGNQVDAIEAYGTTGPSTIINSTISGNATTNPVSGTINNWSGFAMTATNSILLPNPYIPVTYNFVGLTTDATDIETSPLFGARAAPLLVIPFVDDYINLGVAQAVASVAATYGCPISYALNTKLVTSTDWTSIAALQTAGNEIVAHTRSHSDLANNQVFQISYTGPATTATMTINQNKGLLQTFLNGSKTPDLSIPLLDKYNSVQILCGDVTANPAYSCVIQPNQSFFTPIILANVSGANIKTPYMALASSNYLTWEVEGAQSDIAANLPGYQATTFATPYTSSSTAVDKHIQNAGFQANRNGTVDGNLNPNGNWTLSMLDVYNIGAGWLPDQYDATQPAGSVGALVEGLGAIGGVFAVYSHGYNEFTLAQWTQLFQLLQQDGAQCVTLSQARAYIAAHGTLVPDGLNRNWVETINLTPSFANTPASPTQGAHGLQ